MTRCIQWCFVGLVALGVLGSGPQPFGPTRGYQKWVKVTPKPVVFQDPKLALLCRDVVPSDNPHQNQRFLVYVNPAGSQAMRDPVPRFPPGSVIVKEKLDRPESRTPELMTVMVKHKAGYQPEMGDWEYVVLDSAGAVTARDLQRCQSCHASKKATDYVFRGYLPRKGSAPPKG
jgi:hypothetical protein